MTSLQTHLIPALRKMGRALLTRMGRDFTPRELAAPAVVFSPHPDDETLGCGGTILRKKFVGAPVTAVFMTDGSTSHERFIAGEQLRALRREEALAACAVLGIAPRDVVFLDFKDGRLTEAHDDAVRAVRSLLPQLHFHQVFVPYFGDTTPDHIATRSVVLAALRQSQTATTVFEYPVWFWRQLPWASVPVYSRQDIAIKALRAVFCCLRAVRDLRCRVQISDVLEKKREALTQHRTQTQRMPPHSSWPILSDVSGGEFLDCFFQQQEVFYRHTT